MTPDIPAVSDCPESAPLKKESSCRFENKVTRDIEFSCELYDRERGRNKEAEMTDTIQIGARIPKRLYEHIKRLARKEAVERDSDVTLADLVRETLAERFPFEEMETEASQVADGF